MMRWIVASSLQFRFLVIASAAAMLFFGLGQLHETPLDVFPEFAPPRVEIQTPCTGLSAEEVEALVSVPMEQALNGVEGLEVMRSRSIPDLSAIELIFKPGTDILRARQLVQERIATVIPTLPTWAAPPVMMPPISTTGRVMKIGVSSQTVSLNDLSMVAYWNIRARLLRVPGVANVPIWGERIKMPQVQVDPQRMVTHDVSLEQVMDVTSGALDSGLLQFSTGSVIGTGGFFQTPNQRFSIRHISPITTPEDLGQIPIDNRVNADGTPLRLKDVAEVIEGTWPLIGDAVVNDGPGLLLVVEKYPWANTLDVTHGVEKALVDLQPGLPGITVDPSIFRPADFIQMALDNLGRSLVLGCLFVVLVLSLFLFEWRTALISLIAIPLSLVAGALVLHATGASINTMVLAGFVIAVGVVVDDAIIDVENIVRRLRQQRIEGGSRSTASVILDASLEVRSAIVYATLIDVTMLVPVFFIGGVSGAFFAPLALSYGLAVLASMLVALTVTPALCLILLTRAPIQRRRSPLIGWLQRGYGRALSPIVRAPQLAYIAVGVISIVGAAVVPLLGESLFPTFKERDFLVHLITKPGTPVAEERRIVTNASRAVREVPGVQNFGAHIGQALLADEISGVNFGEGWISVNPSVDYATTVAAIQEVVDGYPGMFHNVLTYLNERIDEVLSGSGHALVVRVYGPDLEGIRDKADDVRDALTGVDGIADLHVELQEEIPQVQVEVQLDEAQRYGLKPGDVRRAAATLLSGEEVGDIFREGKAYDVNVWSTPATRANLDSVRDLLLDTPNGGHVRMGDVADINIVPASNLIQRENDSRRIDVGADVRGRDVGSVAHDVEQRLQAVSFPLGYHAEVLGEYAERQAAQSRLFGFALAAAVGVLLLLAAAFGNWRLATLSFLTLPSALVGGILAAYLGGGILSLGSLVGFLTVFGIAARNGIMLINHYQHLERFEGESFGPLLIMRGASERLSPILMTALATGLALVPLVIAGDIPGHEIEHPMAIVILGGLVTSTLLNLFIVPAIFLRFGRTGTPHRPEPVRQSDRPSTNGHVVTGPGAPAAVTV
jgi:CzcA family heavy metal efflux pump